MDDKAIERCIWAMVFGCLVAAAILHRMPSPSHVIKPSAVGVRP